MLIRERQWGKSFAGRVMGLVGANHDLKIFEKKIRAEWVRERESIDLD